MKKTIIILLAALLALSVFVACDQDFIVDDMFDGGSEPVGSKVTITFNANYGENPETTTQEVEKEVETALAANSFTSPDENYVFAGWTTDADGEKAYYGDKESVTLTEDLTLYAQWGSSLDSSSTTWADGLTYTLVNDVSISSARINVNGNVKLFIPNGKTLTASNGITVTESTSLTINGKGSLIAGGDETTPSFAAGIGGCDDQAGGKITINGGTVIATGRDGGAGIGGGYYRAGGPVTITSGTVTATGGEYAAGIGGGYNGAGGPVTITGGSVTAQGGDALDTAAVGIGGGYGSSSNGTLTIGTGETLYYSTDGGSSYTAYSGSDYSTRYQYMKAE